LDTPGFRQVLMSLDDFRQTQVYGLAPLGRPLARVARLGELGLGVETAEPVSDHTQGALQSTAQPLDFAIQGNGFFRVETPAGERLTRDGRFNLDVDGQLVTVDGYRVLGENGAPLTLPSADVVAAADGTLTDAQGQVVGQIGLAVFTDPAAELERDPAAGNLFIAAGAPTGAERGTLAQGFLEAANVNPAELMTQMVAVSRAYQAAQRLVQVQDELLGRALTTLGRL
jgi:flagellar basal body rod protein FlgG